MKRLLPFVFCLFFLVACEKEEDGIPEVQAQYVLKEIQYSLGEGDGVHEEMENLPQRVIENKTGSAIEFVNPDFENVKNESLFESIDPNAFLLAESDSIIVPTPSLISGETIFTQKDYFYADSLQQGIPNITTSSTTTIFPNNKLTIDLQIRWKILTVTYWVVFEDKATGLEKKASGKWTGRIYSGSSGNYTYDEIK